VEGSSEYGNEPAGFLKDGELFIRMRFAVFMASNVYNVIFWAMAQFRLIVGMDWIDVA
jgi:hypothetical protein